MNVETLEAGCYIDGSHMKSSNFDLAVIGFGMASGWTPQLDTDLKVIEAASNGASGGWVFGDGDEEVYIEEYLHEIADEAIEWLNDEKAAEDHYWGIDEQSLFYGPIVDEFA